MARVAGREFFKLLDRVNEDEAKFPVVVERCRSHGKPLGLHANGMFLCPACALEYYDRDEDDE